MGSVLCPERGVKREAPARNGLVGGVDRMNTPWVGGVGYSVLQHLEGEDREPAFQTQGRWSPAEVGQSSACLN